MKWKLAVLATLAVGVMGCGQKEYYMPKAAPTKESTFVDQMRTKCNGDVSKLTPEERQQMDQITRGNTELVIKMGPPKEGEVPGK